MKLLSILQENKLRGWKDEQAPTTPHLYISLDSKRDSKTFLYNYILSYSSYFSRQTYLNIFFCFVHIERKTNFTFPLPFRKNLPTGKGGGKKSESNNNGRIDEMTFHVHLGSRKLGE